MRPVEAARLLSEALRVLWALPAAERARRHLGPAPAVARVRDRGRRAAERDPGARARLRRAIAGMDRCLPGGGNCYRRALLEIALDRGAAGEALYLDLAAAGGEGSGHARLASWPDDGRGYDATLAL